MFDLTVGGVQVLVLVFGLVEFIKGLGVKGRKLTLLAAGIGAITGITIKLGQMYPGLLMYLDVAVYGIGWGLAASGVYKFMDKRFPKWADLGPKDDHPNAA